MSVSGPTDENVPVPGPADDAAPGGGVTPPQALEDVRPRQEAVPGAPEAVPATVPATGDAAPDDADPAESDTAHVEHDVTTAQYQVRPMPYGAVHAESDLATRSCAYCGRTVPQPGESAPAVRYCLDNEGACARAAAERRRRDQDTPGLAGQVARTWDMVERLEDVAELLAMSLTGDLSVAGVERRIAEARAEAAAGVALAHKDREAARLEAEQVLAQLGAVSHRAQRAEAEAAELAAQLGSARVERDTARDIGTQATRTAEAANAAITAVRDEQDRLTHRIGELTSALDLARDEIDRYRAELAKAKEAQRPSAEMEDTRLRLRAAESELDKMRTTTEIVQKARTAAEQACAEADRQALEARSHAEKMSAERDATAAELESCLGELEAARSRLVEGEQLAADLEASRREANESRARLLEQQLQSRERAQMVDQLRGALATMLSERDAARAEADEVKAKLEHLVQGRVGPPPGARHARPTEIGPATVGPEPEPPPGPFPTSPPGHDLGDVTGPPESFRRRFLPPADE
jgi:hypothetical protein